MLLFVKADHCSGSESHRKSSLWIGRWDRNRRSW